MSCAGYFEDLLRQARVRYSFNNQVLEDIYLVREGLRRKLRSYAIQGDFHKVNQIRVQIDLLNRTEKSMKKLLEA